MIKVTGFTIKLREKMLVDDCELIMKQIKKIPEISELKTETIEEREIRKEFLNFSIVEINKQIKERQEIKRQLVGSLYPSIIDDEIWELEELKKKKTRDDKLKYDVIDKE